MADTFAGRDEERYPVISVSRAARLEAALPAALRAISGVAIVLALTAPLVRLLGP